MTDSRESDVFGLAALGAAVIDVQQRLERIERLLEAATTVRPVAEQPVGDCYLSADGCALLLGITTKDGAPNRRGFLERVSVRGSFPNPLVLGNEKKWRRSQVLQWADDEARLASTRRRT